MTSLSTQLKDSAPSSEPTLVVGSVTTSVAGLLSLVLYFFPSIPSNVIQVLLVASAFILPLLTAVFTRGKVWSPDSVRTVVDEAVAAALEQAEKNRTSKIVRTLREIDDSGKPVIRPATDI